MGAHECRCDNYCDNFCDDEPNGCARTCRILNGVFEHIPSVHAGDRTCTWHAYFVTNPINNEGYDCSWMTGTGEGGHGDNCQDWTSDGAFEVPAGQPEPEQLPLLRMVSVHEARASPTSEVRWWAKGLRSSIPSFLRLLPLPLPAKSARKIVQRA